MFKLTALALLFGGCLPPPAHPVCYRRPPALDGDAQIVCVDSTIEDCEAADQGICNVYAGPLCGPTEVWVSISGPVPDNEVTVNNVVYTVVTGPDAVCTVSP